MSGGEAHALLRLPSTGGRRWPPGQGLLGQVEGRTARTVVDWLDARGAVWQDQVATRAAVGSALLQDDLSLAELGDVVAREPDWFRLAR